MASSVKVATVKTTPSRPSTAKVMACASLATKTAALDASLSRLHSIPARVKTCHSCVKTSSSRLHSNTLMALITTILKITTRIMYRQHL